MYLITYFNLFPEILLTINYISLQGGFGDGKDTKCWISTDVPLEENN